MTRFHSMMSHTLPAALMLSATLYAPVAFAQAAGSASAVAATSGTAETMNSTDKGFVMDAAMGGMAEVALGKLAQQKAGSDAVKQYAAHMVEDHTKANEELKQAAGAQSAALPTALDKKHQSMADKMAMKSGADFDRDYMKAMVADHKKTVSLFEKESRTGKNAALKAYATKTLPTLQEHYKMAQSLNDTVKSAKSTSGSTGMGGNMGSTGSMSGKGATGTGTGPGMGSGTTGGTGTGTATGSSTGASGSTTK